MTPFSKQNICPFCGNQNKCMAQSEKPCWCSNAKIPQRLIDLVPPAFKHKSCICLDCIDSFTDNPAKFEQQLAQ